MRGNLDRVMPHVFKNEGGYVDHPKDPGGATNHGITHITLADWRGKSVTKNDVRALTKDEATRIYERNYAKPIHFDELPSGVDYAVLDFAINSGPSRAARYLQKVVGAAQDGKIGVKTLAAVGKIPAHKVINDLCDMRLDFLRGLPTWPTFRKGWSTRIQSVRKEALKLAGASPAPAPIPPPPDVPPVAPKPPVKPTPTGVGIGIGALLVLAGGAALAKAFGLF